MEHQPLPKPSTETAASRTHGAERSTREAGRRDARGRTHQAGPGGDHNIANIPVHAPADPERTAPPRRRPNRSGLPDDLKAGIESLSGVSMDGVNVHYNSPRPARVAALAYAQGRDIHIAPGQEAHLPHEAWHIVQQAQGRVRPTMQLKGGVAVNDNNGLEREADTMGAMSAKIGRGNTALPFAGRMAPAAQASVVQRAVDQNHQFGKGTIRVKLDEGRSQVLQAGNKAAPTVDAVVTYTPRADAPDADPIRLIQTVRTENPVSHAIGSWADTDEARRDKTQTAQDDEHGIQAGWFVDHSADSLKPRSGTGDPVVPDAYVDASFAQDPHAGLGAAKKSYAQLGNAGNQHGKKQGAAITPAVLTDHPASAEPYDFRAEVVVKGREAGGDQLYGTAKWNFTTGDDGDGGQEITAHTASFHDAPSNSFNAAVDKYNEVYRNPGAATSPENIERLKGIWANPESSAQENEAARAGLERAVASVQANASDSDQFQAAGLAFGIQQFLTPPPPPSAPVGDGGFNFDAFGNDSDGGGGFNFDEFENDSNDDPEQWEFHGPTKDGDDFFADFGKNPDEEET